MKIYGLSILENALKGNTCFRESVASMVTLCDETYVFILNSVDGTEKALEEKEKFHLRSLLGAAKEANALQTIREDCENIPEAWCLSLRPDEVLSIDDLELLKEDVKKATELGCEAICFRNLNFSKDPHTISVSAHEPEHSIRLFRLGCDSYLNQEVALDESVYYSEVKLFNYSSLRKYKEGLLETKFISANLLSYLGKHPLLMKRRLINWGGAWERLETAKVYILGEPRDFNQSIIKKIKSKKVIWVGNITEVPADDRVRAIILNPTLFQKIFRSSKVTKKFKALKNHPWTSELFLTLKLSEKGISFD